MLRIALVIFALAAGGAAAWVALLMRSDPAPVTTRIEQTTPVATQEVLVAAIDLVSGQTVIKENMRWQSWPESALNSAYIVRSARPDALENLANSYVRSHMSLGEPIRDGNLLPATGGFLSTLLSSGKRAVAVRVTAESAAGGFILPNDRVDVLLTAVPQGESAHFTTTILSNVQVLAIDQSVDDRSNDEKIKAKAVIVGRTATLELELKQAEILTAGEATGTISLALRSAADNAEKPTMLQSGQSLRSSMIGSTKIYQMVPSNTPVETNASRRALGRTVAPLLKAAPGDLQAVQQGGGSGASIR